MKIKNLSTIVLLSFFFTLPFYISAKPKSDRQQIIDHIHSIFQAFVREDTTGHPDQAHRGLDGFSE